MAPMKNISKTTIILRHKWQVGFDYIMPLIDSWDA